MVIHHPDRDMRHAAQRVATRRDWQERRYFNLKALMRSSYWAVSWA
jgi:hypothetical protein